MGPWEIVRGDGDSREIYIPMSMYDPNGKVRLTVKEEADNDMLDNSAKLKVDMTADDLVETDRIEDGESYAVYLCTITPEVSDLAPPGKWTGEISYEDGDGIPTTATTFKFNVIGDYGRRRG